MAVKPGSIVSPIFVSALMQDVKPVQANAEQIIEQNGGTDFLDVDGETFKYDPINYPLKSTQQLNIDWSAFENHTFFSSAEVKVNEAFDLLINKFPFDGSKTEVQKYLDKLSGFEKYVYNSFPTWSGALHFSGTQVGEDTNGTLGTWISVKDSAGYLYPEISKNSSGDTIINPTSGSMSIEALVYIPKITNSTQVIFQKRSTDSDGFTFHLTPTTSIDYATASFSVTSGSARTSAAVLLDKGVYNHICLVFNADDNKPDALLQVYVNENLKAASDVVNIKNFNIDKANFFIGSGSSFYVSSSLVTPTQTFSGSLDELRIFHSIRSVEKQKLFASRGIYSTPDLKLYYRFNEPPPLLSNFSENESINSIVLDSSGNSLHANISNFTGSLRINAEEDSLSPVKNEKREFSIVLFPAYNDVKNYNIELLTSASLFDAANPNLIAKLIPKHYLLMGAADDGFIKENGNRGQAYGGSGIPGQGEIGSTHLILTLLYVWAKFFDDMKLFVQSFGTLRTIDYNSTDTAPDNFLSDIIRSHGFYLPAFFNHENLDKYLDDSDGAENTYTSGVSFKSVHTQLLRRIIININDVIKSKGTQHSIRSYLRSIGIDPDNSLRIREYGGPTVKMLGSARNKKLESIPVVDISSASLLISAPLSASRVEPGFPQPAGQFVTSGNQIIGTTVASDALLTSGSWNIECLYKFPPYKLFNPNTSKQSLLRLVVTGSDNYAQQGLLANVVAFEKTNDSPSCVKAFISPGTSVNSPLLTLSLELSGAGLFDGERWNVSLGRQRADEIGSGYLSSSYYLRVGKSNFGEIEEVYIANDHFYERNSTDNNAFEFLSSSFNASGSYIAIGGGQNFQTSTTYPFLNNTAVTSDARTTTFYGWLSHLRFWSKFVSEDEWKEHLRNYKSLGVSDPFKNYNFVNKLTGSFNKIRLDALAKQPITSADADGKIIFVDHSGNNNAVSGTLFGSGSYVITGDVESHSYLSPDFDESSTDDKIRIRGLLDTNNFVDNPWAIKAPVYSSNEYFVKEEPQDDLRLSIEFSLTDALDRDIITMFSTLDTLGDAIGRPELMFSPDYPDLQNLSDVYFNRLIEKLNFKKFFEFYRWFDSSISTFIEQLVPGKTRYKGTNFVIESHMLERHKMQSLHYNNYIENGAQTNNPEIFVNDSKEFTVNIK